MFQRAGYFGQLHLLAVELSESDAEAVAASVGALEGKVGGESELGDGGGRVVAEMVTELTRWAGGDGEDHRFDLDFEDRELHKSI